MEINLLICVQCTTVMSARGEDGSGPACDHPAAPSANRHKNISWSPSTEHFCMKNYSTVHTPRGSSTEGRRMTKRKNAMAILAASEKEDTEKEDAEKEDACTVLDEQSPDTLDYMLQTWITQQQKEEEDAGTVLDEELTDELNDMFQTSTSTTSTITTSTSTTSTSTTSTSTTSTVQPLMSNVEPLTDVQQASIWFMCA